MTSSTATTHDRGVWVPLNDDQAVLCDAEGRKHAVRTGPEVCPLDELVGRIERGEKGDDIPIVMELFGCAYESACDLVFAGDKDAAKAYLLKEATTAFEYGWVRAKRDNMAFLKTLGAEIGGYDDTNQRFHIRIASTDAIELRELAGADHVELTRRTYDVAKPYGPANASRQHLLGEKAFIDYHDYLGFHKASVPQWDAWIAQRTAIKQQLAAMGDAPAAKPPVLVIEAYGTVAANPRWALVDLTPVFLDQLSALRELCDENHLLNVGATGGPRQWERSHEWRPDIPQLLVTPGEFRFLVHSKLDDELVETAFVPIARLMALLKEGEVHNANDFRWHDGTLYYADDDAAPLLQAFAEHRRASAPADNAPSM